MATHHHVERKGPVDFERPPTTITFRINEDGQFVSEIEANGCGEDFVLMCVARLNYELAITVLGDPCREGADEVADEMHEMIHGLRWWAMAAQTHYQHHSTEGGD